MLRGGGTRYSHSWNALARHRATDRVTTWVPPLTLPALRVPQPCRGAGPGVRSPAGRLLAKEAEHLLAGMFARPFVDGIVWHGCEDGQGQCALRTAARAKHHGMAMCGKKVRRDQ